MTIARRLFSNAITLLLLAAFTSSFPAPAADAPPADTAAAEVALQRALDQPFNLVLEKVEIAEAFKRIAATAKISLSVDPACYDFLPYGATTRVSADFRNSKLRDAIEQVLITLGLQQTVSGSAVIIRPSAPLMHIGRRAQLDELKLLQDLRSNELLPAPISPTNPATQPATLDWTTAIRTALDRQNIVVSLEGDTASPLHAKAIDEIQKQLPMSIFRGLETYCQITSQIWFAEADPYSSAGGSTIHIMSMKRWIIRQLDRPIQVNFVNTPSDQVLAELSHLTGIRFVPEPGLYAAFPALNLKSGNGSVLQTLEALAGGTSIAYDVREDSILLHVSGSAPTPVPAGITTQPATQSDNIVAYLAVPTGPTGRLMNVVIRESDLPPELNNLRKQKIHEAVQLLEHAWIPPTPAPTTQPATQPSTQPAQ